MICRSKNFCQDTLACSFLFCVCFKMCSLFFRFIIRPFGVSRRVFKITFDKLIIMITNFQVEECSKCGNQTYLTNRTYKLCENCNCIRMHGVGIFEWNNRKRADYIKKVKEKNKVVKKERIPYFSFKGESTYKKLLSVKKEVRLQAIAADTYFCKGCGRGDIALDCSHIIAVSQRPDLQLDKENINLFCRACHDAWGDGDIVKMLKLNSFKKDVEYILMNDNERFEKIMTKLRSLENVA